MSPLDPQYIGELPPETTGGLTFHLPMEMAALRDAGASPAVLAARSAARLAEAFAAGMVDPPAYRWALGRYRATADGLLSPEAAARAAAVRDLDPLADGLAGAAFHGLIRLGYGAWQQDVHEVARGLAYLRTRRQVLGGGGNGEDGGARAADLPPTPEPSAAADLPPYDQRDGLTVFTMLDLAAGSHDCACTPSGDTPAALAARAAHLVLRNPSSFVSVHALTGLHALVEVERCAGEPLRRWWQVFAAAQRACALVVESGPPEALAGYDGRLGPANTMDEIVTAAIASNETHDVKLAVALRRLVGFGVLPADLACEVGRARLAAPQLDG